MLGQAVFRTWELCAEVLGVSAWQPEPISRHGVPLPSHELRRLYGERRRQVSFLRVVLSILGLFAAYRKLRYGRVFREARPALSAAASAFASSGAAFKRRRTAN